jgi:hypothetical protein
MQRADRYGGFAAEGLGLLAYRLGRVNRPTCAQAGGAIRISGPSSLTTDGSCVCHSTRRREQWPVGGWRSCTRRDSRVRSSSVHRATRTVRCAWEPWRNGQRARLSRGRLRDHTPSAPLPSFLPVEFAWSERGSEEPDGPVRFGGQASERTTNDTPAWWNGRHATLRTSWAPPMRVQVPPPVSPKARMREVAWFRRVAQW